MQIDYLKQQLLQEMLSTWQPVAALAERCSVHPNEAKKALEELTIERKIIATKGRIDGHNKTTSYRKIKFINILGVYTIIG